MFTLEIFVQNGAVFPLSSAFVETLKMQSIEINFLKTKVLQKTLMKIKILIAISTPN